MTAVSRFENRKVLVLNKMWTAINICTLRDALPLLFKFEKGQPKAQVVSENFSTYTWADWAELRPKDGEECISTIHRKFCIPEIVRLTHQDKMFKKSINFNRRALYRRDNYTCQYCGCKPGSEELTIDHVLPRYHGGLTTWDNCAVACVGCNSKKAARTPAQAGMKLLSVPKRPKLDLLASGSGLLKSWKHFLSEAYWSVELENDEVE